MSEANNKQNDDDLASDILYGAKEIAKYIGRPRAFVYSKQEYLGLCHCGSTLVASKSRLRNRLASGD